MIAIAAVMRDFLYFFRDWISFCEEKKEGEEKENDGENWTSASGASSETVYGVVSVWDIVIPSESDSPSVSVVSQRTK